MTDDYDDNAVYGDEIGYVPCFQAASAVPTLVADDNAVYGEESGYVPFDTAAAADPASEQDELAVYGDNVGFVAKPCEELFDFEHAVGGIIQNIGNSSYHKQIKRVTGSTTLEDGPPGDTITDFGTLVGTGLSTFYRPGLGASPDERWETEGRTYFAHDAPFYEFGGAGGLPLYNFARLRARLITASFYPLSGSPVAVDWVLANANLGAIGDTSDPDWDASTGSALQAGTLAENEAGGPFANFVDIDIWISVVGGRAAWALVMGAQPFLNGEWAKVIPAPNEPVVVPRFPAIGAPAPAIASPESWAGNDSWGLERGTTGPTDTSSFVTNDYWLQWYEVPLF